MEQRYSKYAIAWTVALGLFMAVLDGTIVNVALTPMGTSLRIGLSDIQWVITAYLLTQAAVIPVAGYLATRWGLKRMYLLCLALFILGSFLCALAQNEATLISFRVVQGLGGGALFPLVQSIALRAFAPQERATSSAIVGVSALVAPALGPTIGGVLTDTFGWPFIFLVNVPVGLLAVLLAWRIIPRDSAGELAHNRFDVVGLLLSICGVLAIIYAFTVVSQVQPGTVTGANPRGDIYGWSYWLVWALLGTGVGLLSLFALYELRVSRDPVLDLRLFQKYSFALPSLINWLVAMAIFGSFFLLPVFLESVRLPHLSATDAGLLLFPQGVASAIAVFLSGQWLYNRLGVRNLILIGAGLLVVGTWGFTRLATETDLPTIVGWSIVRGLGFGLTFVPVQTRALQEITGPALAKASSLLNVGRQIFSSVGTTIAGVLFTQQTIRHSTEIHAAAVGTHVPLALSLVAARAATLSLDDVFMGITLAAVLILVVAVALPANPQFIRNAPTPAPQTPVPG